MKIKPLAVLAFLALFLFPLAAVKAADARTGNTVYIPKEEIVNGNLYAVGETITIDGTISGDLITVAQTVTVNGRVEGDVIALGQDIFINGSVGGNIRIAGNTLNINGDVARNVNVFGAKVVLGPDSHIGWDVYVVGANSEIRGTIDGSLGGQAGQALITGKIGKNVNLKLSGDSHTDLTITSEAIINGDVTYNSKNAASISPKSSIAGKVQQQSAETKKSNSAWLWLWQKLFSVFSALAVGLVLIFIGKNISAKILGKISESPAKMLLPGLVIMFILPPIALVLIFTLIGIPLALMIGAWWISATYIAKIYAAIFIGQFILKKIMVSKESSLSWSLILGVIISWLIFSIPYVGWVISLFAAWLGLGAIWFYTTEQLGINNQVK